MAGPINSIDKAFALEPSLRKRIYTAIEHHPEQSTLFQNISDFMLNQYISHQTSNGTNHTLDQQTNEPPSKKRRLETNEASSRNALQSQPPSGPGRLIFEARDISFSLPQRKKLHLGILEHGSPDQPIEKRSFSIQIRNPGTNQVEGTYSLGSYGHALRLPVPEKNQKQYNFCLLPAPDKVTATEPIIWTINHGPLKSYKIESPDLKALAPGPDDVLENVLNVCLKNSGVTLIMPSEKEFASALRESHRKNDVAYHVKAFRGSKEGYLFFLENGIFFGFKKPLSFFSFNEIESISYTSVLQRTFNLNITIRPSQEAETQEIEYSMLDQQDFAGIDAYIKNHQLQDASLAEARRAKKAGKATNAAVGETNGDGDDNGRTELEKAQAELEDEEDEMEEDYDPDEEEDDDGSGSESESGAEEYVRGKGRNLIAEELGSEAEDVSVTEDEDEDADETEGEEDDVDELQADQQPSIPSRPQAHPQAPLPKHIPGAPSLDDDDQL